MSTPGNPATDLAGRYGDPLRSRWIAIVTGTVVAVAFLGWLAWATWDHANPQVTSELRSNGVVDEHTAVAVVEVDLAEDAEDVNCQVRALASDHTVVGVLDFEPVDGRNDVTIVTEREATAVELVGCTAKGQPRPR